MRLDFRTETSDPSKTIVLLRHRQMKKTGDKTMVHNKRFSTGNHDLAGRAKTTHYNRINYENIQLSPKPSPAACWFSTARWAPSFIGITFSRIARSTSLSLSDPKLIRSIHAEYRDAGADVLTTNTFGANRIALGAFRLGGKGARDQSGGGENRPGSRRRGRSADLRRRFDRAAARLGGSLALPAMQIEDLIAEQVESLMEGGADFILFETQPTRAALEKCAAAMQPQAGDALRAFVLRWKPTARRPPARRSSG